MDLFKLVGTIALNGVNDAKDALDGVTGSAEKAQSKLSGAFGKIGTAAKVGAKAVTAAVTAAATAISVVTKNAVENYAEYEQLVGGVETLFGDSANTVMQYAENAYKTAGLSANEYMETVTSFSASLLQSLGGDTVKAAEMADLAITDMADNANKMGSDMTSIQNAYQGFAKQNYTMLDNLKLGYGGTKEEMERLIDYANALNAAQGKLTDYSIDSYADIVSAIHDVQTEMGITGTTAEEASETIQGSISSAKAAWQNWLTALGDGNADIETKTDELIESISIAATNILPVFEQVLSSLGTALGDKLPELLSNAVEFVVTHLPDIIELGWQLIVALLDGLNQGFGELIAQIKLPHFSISPEGWKLADLLKGSIPQLSVAWYAKGGVFDEPTIFPTANGLKGVGEAGAEAVAPIDVLQGYVAAAVASQNTELVLILQKILSAILELDANMGGNLREALDGTSLKVNQREFGRLVRGVTYA